MVIWSLNHDRTVTRAQLLGLLALMAHLSHTTIAKLAEDEV